MLDNTKKKISDSLKKFYREHSKTTSAVGAYVGAKTILNQFHSGNLTGRKTLFHGTSNKSAADIVKNGFNSAKTGISNAVDPALHAANKGLVFATPNKGYAKLYARQQAALEDGIESLKKVRLGQVSKEIKKASNKGIVKLNIPTWQEGLKGVVNPEVAMAKAKIASSGMGRIAKKTSNYGINSMFGEKAVHTAKGIPSSFIKGNAAYKPNSLGEIAKYAGGNKARLVGGIAKAAIGAAAIGISGSALTKEQKRKNTLLGKAQQKVNTTAATIKSSLKKEK